MAAAPSGPAGKRSALAVVMVAAARALPAGGPGTTPGARVEEPGAEVAEGAGAEPETCICEMWRRWPICVWLMPLRKSMVGICC